MRRKAARSPADQGRIIRLPEPRYRGANRRVLPTEERAYLGRLLKLADDVLQHGCGSPCPLCRGSGHDSSGNPCPTCEGAGDITAP